MDLVAVDWFKSTKRMDHVAKRSGCAAQVSYRNNDSTSLSSFNLSLNNTIILFKICHMYFIWFPLK